MLSIIKKIFPKQINEICCVSTGRTGTNFLFGKLMGWAFVLAIPLAYFGTDGWLANFVFRIEVGISTFVVAGCLSMVPGGP